MQKNIDPMHSKKDKLKPSVEKPLLLFISGLMWFCIGVMLNAFAVNWLMGYEGKWHYLFAGIGFFMALIIHHFGFLRIVDKNLGRIKTLEERPSVFAFMSWRSYVLVLIMVSMGIALRHSALPKQYLSIIYIAIGLALMLSSIRYFRIFVAWTKSGTSDRR